MKRKKTMPRFYGKNIARNAQKKFFRRKALESADREKRLGLDQDHPVKNLD